MWNGNSLAGQRVLVTAGASGIGLDIVRAFAAAGARVFVCDVQSESLDRLSTELPEVGSCLADVSNEEQVARLFDAADRELGGLDVLVNNAGVAGPTGGVETLSLDDWNRTLAVNITGQFLCARLAVPRLRQGRHPSIVNLSSAAGHLGMPGRSPYAASKWAVIAAKAQALGKPIEEVTRIYTSQSALNRMVTAGDIANMVLFAASDLAASVTGQELVVDGHTQALS